MNKQEADGKANNVVSDFEGNADELIAQMQADELDGATKMSPRDYGKSRGIAPQLVYYHLREGHLNWTHCDCGRRVINIDEADKYFKKGSYSE